MPKDVTVPDLNPALVSAEPAPQDMEQPEQLSKDGMNDISSRIVPSVNFNIASNAALSRRQDAQPRIGKATERYTNHMAGPRLHLQPLASLASGSPPSLQQAASR
ncbi:hypothetical protein TgHK011_007539 [Trichoderma gracile]|nr:hypothetical protein TgHK011_007539 [Trichoderma gracile]